MKTVTFKGKNVRVGKILCLGRNYAAHAREMLAAIPEKPVVFIKPSTALLRDGEKIIIPPISRDLHHEVELVVMIGKGGTSIDVSAAMEHVAGYGVGLDMTLRDVQAEAKKNGLPWSVAKGFDTSAPVSTIVGKEAVGNPHALSISLRVNGEIRQQANTGDMIFRIDHVVSYLSSLFTLERGDLIFTGTPEGVARVVSGDVLVAELESVGRLQTTVR